MEAWGGVLMKMSNIKFLVVTNLLVVLIIARMLVVTKALLVIKTVNKIIKSYQ